MKVDQLRGKWLQFGSGTAGKARTHTMGGRWLQRFQPEVPKEKTRLMGSHQTERARSATNSHFSEGDDHDYTL